MQTLDTKRQIIPNDKLPRLTPEQSAPVLWLLSVLKTLLWLLAGSLITLIFLECLFSVIHCGEQEWAKVDPLLGFAHLENKVVTFQGEGFSRERINSAGCCDIERSIVKPVGVTRIAVLGDSQTESLQVPLKDRFTSLLAARLNQEGKQKVEVLNFGMSSYSPGQDYLLYITKVAAYKPDITILCYHDGDDEKDVDLASLRPTFALHEKGHLSVRWVEFDHWRKSDVAWPFTFWPWGRTHSRVLSILLQTRLALKADPLFSDIYHNVSEITDTLQKLMRRISFASPQKNDFNKQFKEDEWINLRRLELCQRASLSMDTSQRQYPPGVVDYYNDATINLHPTTTIERLQTTRGIIGYLDNACLQNKSRLVLVALPLNNQRDHYQQTLNWYASIQEPNPLPVLNMFPAFVGGQSMPTNPYFFATSHFSVQGHKLAAELLYDFFQKNHLLDPSTK